MSSTWKLFHQQNEAKKKKKHSYHFPRTSEDLENQTKVSKKQTRTSWRLRLEYLIGGLKENSGKVFCRKMGTATQVLHPQLN